MGLHKSHCQDVTQAVLTSPCSRSREGNNVAPRLEMAWQFSFYQPCSVLGIPSDAGHQKHP